MFNRNDASSEIAAAMESALITRAIEKNAEGINKFAKAIDLLNNAAELFDELGLNKEAEATTTLLEIVAAKKKPAKGKGKGKAKARKPGKSDEATKGLKSDKMVENLKEKGWVFNADNHSKGCMCSMCVDINDVRHGDDCICSLCMDSDDDNYHFDASKDFGYHVERDDNYAEIFDVLNGDDDGMHDFENELGAGAHLSHNPTW